MVEPVKPQEVAAEYDILNTSFKTIKTYWDISGDDDAEWSEILALLEDTVVRHKGTQADRFSQDVALATIKLLERRAREKEDQR